MISRHLPGGLRGRREASRRLPPLPDGRRDPLDRPGPGGPTVAMITEQSVKFVPASRPVWAAIRTVGCRWQRLPTIDGVAVPRAAGDDVIAALEASGQRVEVVDLRPAVAL